MSAERVVRVLPDVAAVGKRFDYSVPSSLDELVRIGSPVVVLLHGRRVRGWVVEDEVVPPAGIEVRSIEAVRGWGPPESVVSLALWASWRWAGPATAFLKAASPDRVEATLPSSGATQTQRRDSKSEGEWIDPLLVDRAFAGGSTVVRLPPASSYLPLALAACSSLAGPERTRSVARSTGASGVLLLAPSHDAALQLATGLRRRGQCVALLPGGWALARRGNCVVVGTRSAAFAPLSRLSAAVVFDAHDEAYNEQRAPTWGACDVVSERARRDGAPCVLVSPCPTLDILECHPLHLASRSFEREGWAPVEVIDRRSDDPRTGLYSDRVVSLLRWAVQGADRRVLCVLNRTGRVRMLACAGCGEIARCERCDAAAELVSVGRDRVLRCRRCSLERPVVCVQCGLTRMKAIRVGVSKVREDLEALTGAEVGEVWGRPNRKTRSADRVPTDSDRAASPPSVVVGTEAVLHRMHSADAVVFLDFDSELLAPRMRASEEALSLLARSSRIVARSQITTSGSDRSPGRILVQTRVPEHDVLKAAVAADPSRLTSAEAVVRRSLGLPPFRALALVSGEAAGDYVSGLRDCAPADTDVAGSSDGSWLVTAPDHEQLCNLLAKAARPRGRIRLEVDPVRI